MAQLSDVQRAVLDASSFPVVVLTEQGTLTDAERARVMEGLDELVERRGRHAVVLDLTHGAMLPRAQRTYVTETFFQMREELIVQKWACLAVVIRAPVLEHMPIAAFWLKASPVPARMIPSLTEAVTWARGLASSRASAVMPALSMPLGKARPAR